jgi:hypothetical protein
MTAVRRTELPENLRHSARPELRAERISDT